MKKISTGIKGLDRLFYGGIHLNSLFNPKMVGNNGIIIVIKGAKGCHKTLLALQLMHGLTKSITKIRNVKTPPVFESLNKSKEDLQDMYMDVYVSQMINAMCSTILSSPHDRSILESKFNDVLDEILFEKKFSIEGSLLSHIINRVIYYNPRTNALHRKQSFPGDNEENLIYYRYDDIADILGKCKNLNSRQVESVIDKLLYLPVIYDVHSLLNANTNKTDNLAQISKTALVRLQNIISSLGMCAENEDNKYPCFVIDGLSQLSTQELLAVPYVQLEYLLRKRSDVSILVFDDRPEACINADIVIEMRKKEADDEEYIYNELHILKSVFQTVALGWHQYKKRDTGIDVFPSLHLLLSKRDYLPHKLFTMHNNILEESFEEYLHYNEFYSDKNSDYIEYYKSKVDREKVLLSMIHERHKGSDESKSLITILETIINGELEPQNCHGWCDHYPVSAIIGNPNCFKRSLAIAGAFNAAKKEEHTIFILFDKNESDMRRRMCCPCFHTMNIESNICNADAKCELKSSANNDILIKKCYSCYKYIHFFQIRMGCISAEEFFDALLQQIETFSDKKRKKPCHIVIDDLQKIDYSFPFIKKSSLFLSTLVTLCKQNYTELKIICDKRAGLVGELCSLSDNVLCIKREEKEDDSMTIYLERNFGGIHSSGLYKYNIDEVSKLFVCEEDKITFNPSPIILKQKEQEQQEQQEQQEKEQQEQQEQQEKKERIIAQTIGTMKEFWRRTDNVILKENRISD